MDDTRTDEELVSATLGDRELFAVLMERYEEKLTRYMRRLGVGRREDREDILQNAFIKAYRNLNDFDTALSFSAWMYRIVHNETMSHFRKRKPVLETDLLNEDGSSVFDTFSSGWDTSALAEERLQSEQVARALSKLSDQYREIIVLRFFEERDYQDISDILQIPMGSVATFLHRAKKQLREVLSA